MWITAAVVGGILLLTFFQWRNLRRLKAAVSAQCGSFSRWVWGIDPIAIYQEEVDKSAEEIQQAGESLAEVKGMVCRLQRKVVGGENKVEQLKFKVRTLLQEGSEDKAGTYVLELQRTQEQLVKDKNKLEEHKNLYEESLRKLQFANQKIREAKEKAERMSAELRMSKAEAEVSKLAQNFQINTSSIENFSAIEEEIQRQIDSNRAKGQVIHDLGNDGLEDLDDQERQEKQKAQVLLEQFKQELLLPPPVEIKILPAVKQHENN